MSAREWKRRAVHAGMGLFAPALRVLDWRAAALMAAGALLFNLFAMPRIGRGIYRDPARRRDVGIVSYAAVVLVLVLLYRRRLEIAAAVWGMLAFGDPAAAIAGRAFPGRGLPWNREKSWAGFLANFCVASLAGICLFRVVGSSIPPGSTAAVLAGAATFAFLETLRTGIEDNLVAPVPASLVVWGALAAGPDAWRLLIGYPSFLGNAIVAVALNAIVALVLVRLRVVSPSGGAAGFIAGTLVLGVGGWGAYEVLWVFFALGSAATKLGYAAKAARGLAEAEGGRRGARHVFANCAVAIAILLVAAGRRPFLPDAAFAALTASFAAALADTLGTEVGTLLGGNPVSLLSGRRVAAGAPGAVSWQGTAAGAAGAAAIAAVGFAAGLIPLPLVWVVALAGVIGSLAESLAGDLAARRGLALDHEFGNALNTFAGAAVAAEIALSLSKGSLYLPMER